MPEGRKNQGIEKMTATAIMVIFPLCLAMAAFSDLLTMTIPNRVSIILVAAFLVIAPLAGLSLGMIGMHLVAAAAVFAACFGLFALNIMGGGDAKLLTASALWFGFNHSLVEFLVFVSVFGGLLSVVVLTLKSQSNLIAVSGLRLPKTLQHPKKVPYGIAIGAAAFLTYPSSPLMQLLMSSTN